MTKDPGLQPERTALAWRRTGLAMAANAILLLRSGLQAGPPAVIWLGVAMVVVTVALLLAGEHRRLHLSRTAAAAPADLLILFTSGGAVLASIAALLALLA